MRTTTAAFSGAALLLAVAWATNVDGCTIGVADGTVTSDGRGILWKSAMADTVGEVYPLGHFTGENYDYICFDNGSSSIAFEGLNSAGLSTGNSWAGLGDWTGNGHFMGQCLANCGTVDEVRDYIFWRQGLGALNTVTGCFPFLDAQGQATMFEIDNNTVYEYSTQNPNRAAQNLAGRVVRANEFHARVDGTDDIMISGRYHSGNSNTTGLITMAGDLCARTVVQGNLGHNSGYEFLRYGPNRPMATIATDTVAYSIAVHDVAPGEDPALATMWAMPGQANYTIAVPMWVAVSDLPTCLASGDLATRAMSLRAKGNEGTIVDSTFPFEAHLFSEIEQLLGFWRSGDKIRPGTLARVEHRMAEDAYSLLDCLDNTQDNNKAPSVALQAERNSGLTLDFTALVEDIDGSVLSYEWDFGDWSASSDQPSPSHTYDYPGWHLVSCTVTDDDGVSNTDWEYVYAVPEPATLSLLALVGLTTILIKILNGRKSHTC
jgi:hypothetical protein